MSQSRNTIFYCAIAAAFASIGGIAWWLGLEESGGSSHSTVVDSPSEGDAQPALSTPMPSRRPSEQVEVLQPANPQIPTAVRNNRTITPTELIWEINRTVDASERADTVRALVAIDTPASLALVTSLWKTERHPDVKEALLGAIAETDHETDAAAKIAILGSGLVGQARNVRRAAIDALLQFDNPTATAHLRKAAKSDPDKELREIARELLEGTGRE